MTRGGRHPAGDRGGAAAGGEMHGSRNGVAFVHIPRTAGTSIRHALRLGTGELHVPAARLQERLGRARWRELLTFTVVRHPLERVLSLYLKLYDRSEGPSGFRGWVQDGLPAPCHAGLSASAPMIEWLKGPDRGGLAVEITLKYGDLAAEWARFRGRLADIWPHETPVSLPKTNDSPPSQARIWYDEATKRAVWRAYRADFDLFGYDRTLPCRNDSASVE